MLNINQLLTGIKIFIGFLFVSAMIALPAAQAAEVTLTWQQPADARVDGYYIYYGPAPYNFSSAQPDVEINGRSTTSTVISNLLPNAEYEFAAKSFDSSTGETSAFSDIVSFDTADGTSSSSASADDGGGGSGGGCFISTILN